MTSTDPSGPSRPATAPSQDSSRTLNMTTPKPKSAEGTTTPTSAPAAARYRTNSRPGEQAPPTLLVDFLRGRPSPARLAAQRQMAQRQRRASVDAVRAEIRHEMHQASVRRIQQPGGVKDRVSAWQKANAAAMAKGDPTGPPTEPSDVAFKDDEKSVTEDDRIRIKLRKRSATAPKEPSQKSATLSRSSGSQPETTETAETPQTITPKRKTPPPKRVISDDHWMDKKNKKKASPPRPSTTPKRKSQPNPMPLPKNFVQKTSWTPPASHKVRAWAKDIESMPPEDSPGGVRQLARASKSGDFDEDVDSLIYNDSTPAHSQESSSMRSSRPKKPAKSETDVDDDGIRAAAAKEKEMGKRKKEKAGDAARKPLSVPSDMTDHHDDGIRVAPMKEKEREKKKKEKVVDADKEPPSIPSDITDLHDRIRPTSAPAVEKESSRKCSHKKPRKPSRPAPSAASVSFHDASPYDFVYDRDGDRESDEPTHEPETPTRRGTSKSKPKMGRRSRASAPTEITATTQTTETTGITESTEASGMTEDDSEFTMRGARSPGGTSLESSREPDEPTEGASLAEIPFGRSAFSEVDLPLGADAHNSSTKQKPQRNGSFSAAKVLKRVVSEGRKMIHETVDTPKPAANNPPSIENWLTQTVDPFVDAPSPSPSPSEPAPNPAQTRKSVEKRWAEEDEARQPDRERTPKKADRETTPKKAPRQKSPSSPESIGEDLTPKASREEPKVMKEELGRSPEPQKKTPPSAGLTRKGAKRASASPVKTSAGKFFRDAFKDAFKGQSANQIFNQTSYESREERTYEADPPEEEYYEDRYPSRRSWGSGSYQRSHTPDSYDSRDFDDDWTESSFTSSLPELRRRPPPTNGVHELSTIASETSNSSYGDTMSTLSDLSETTVTQTTALTRESELTRQSSRKSGSGLKRRLTKHSDLVSVLSAPTDASVPYSVRNSRSRASVRRTRSKKQHSVTVDDLMQEFDDDENLYSRELKTLVDGVVPVLLNHAVSESANLLSVFGTNSPGKKVDAMSKAVVGMGISLEKLRNAHRKAPLDDVHALVGWLQGVVSIYSGYLDAWRMGFENLVVNLAPVEDVADDNDSLLDALPRNADGDIVNEDGERVDVAHLLKRPVYRIRMITSFVKGTHAILGMDSTKALVHSFEALQEHARRRHKEERARATDEDAANTDTTRTRDLRTLAPLDYIRIDPSLQVNAKDYFTLSVLHSNGQRMECQVELVHRDKSSDPNHPGDLLIRQTGDSQRTWLLFPPMPLALLSARRGDVPHEVVVMVRGTHNGRQWRELILLSTDDELQVVDWLDILGTDPVPPLATDMKAATPEPESPRRLDDVPVGEKSVVGSVPSPDRAPPSPPESPATSLPSRYRPRSRGQSLVPEKAPMDEQYDSEPSGSELSQPDVPQIEIFEAEPSAPNTKPYREDGAPPPPVHRSLPSKKKASLLLPPTDTRVKRRGSSPLKHEYLPSDGSDSEFTGDSGSETESGGESESDEIDSIDIPDTEIGFSIIKEEDEEDEEEETREETRAVAPDRAPPLPPPAVPDVAQSAVSENSITPSNSASQVGMGAKQLGTSQPTLRFVCSVSHWSDKRGTWKDLSKDPCAVAVSAGKMEVFTMKATGDDPPLVALDLTPLVLIRKSNAVDFEVRTALMEHSKLQSLGGGTFRFRNSTQEECLGLYGAVHDARLKNEKYMRLENEARFRSFGERRPPVEGDEGSGSSRMRSWFGRKNSYRASARAPARSAEDASTTPSTASASSFLRRLAAGANMTFNIGRSSVEKQGSRAGSFSFHTSSGSSAEGSMPRSPSLSIGEGSRGGPISPDNVPIRLHLLVSPSKWEDYGNCRLQVRRPPEGWRQELRADHGLEKRVTVSTVPKKKDSEPPRIILDAVLGSGCFGSMGTRGIVCSVWEEMRDEYGRAGAIPQTSSPGGSVKKWCFQVGGVGNAGWLLALLHEEVVRA